MGHSQRILDRFFVGKRLGMYTHDIALYHTVTPLAKGCQPENTRDHYIPWLKVVSH